MTYRAPLDDILLALNHGAGFAHAAAAGHLGDYDAEMTSAILEEAGKFAANILAPLNSVGDKIGARLDHGQVITAPGWTEAYRAWIDGGWGSLTAPEIWGGQNLPSALNSACMEMWNSANMGFALCPMLTMGAIDALEAHGSDTLRQIYLAKMISGEWTGTMHLTEPQAGSDVGALRTRAEPVGDGTYRISGSKIFITYGEHDLTDNIVHLVLARLPDAPPGTKGISLFLVPKFMVKADGSLGARNDIRVASIEHKLGIHGSPTCVMVMGDQGGAIGYLIGEENRGMACMFTMMNQARLGVGLEGVGLSERAYQQALAYAHERKQGRGIGSTTKGADPIIVHPDIKRMLLTMHAMTRAARTICYSTAVAIDISHRATDAGVRAAATARAALLTPIAKAFSTDIGVESASLGIQVHGGMGFIEETGAAQYYRDARIAPIYEGTNGIQAIDLLTRKLAPDGAAALALMAELTPVIGQIEASNNPAFGHTAARLRDAVSALERTSRWMLTTLAKSPNEALAGATPFLRMWGITLGGCLLAREAIAAATDPAFAHRAAASVTLARFFAENVTVGAGALERTICEGAGAVGAADTALAI